MITFIAWALLLTEGILGFSVMTHRGLTGYVRKYDASDVVAALVEYPLLAWAIWYLVSHK